MQISRVRRRSWGVISGCLMATLVWAQSLVVIDLKYRRAEEIIPVLQPLLEQGGALSGQDYKLFVRSANLPQIRSVLAQLDKQQKQMLVSVRRGTAQDIERGGASASGTLRTDGRSEVNVRAGESSLRTQGESVSSVQVLEGSSAFIATGSSVPIVTAVAVGSGRRPFVAGTIEQRNLQRGFMVTPRLNGDQVVLEISQQDERVANGGIQTQSLNTQVMGRVGAWIQLGGVTESSSRSENGILSREYSTGGNNVSVWVKVEPQ